MSTRTTNYGLYMPDQTDPFEDFRAEHNSNMQIIDGALGGGGSGGHTIVDPSGTDMPAESKLQFTGGVTVTDDSVNGKTVVDISGGGGNVYGAFIDTNRVIASGTYSVNFSYTATEDCFVYAVVPFNGNSGGQLQIDGETINGWWNGTGSTISESFVVPVKKGQTITATATNSSASSYIVYGLTQGTNGIFTPIIYSDTERVVGVWRDNKPLYQKSVYVGSLSAGSEVSFAHNIANIDTIANYEGIGFNTVESRWNTLPRVDDDVTYQRGLAVGATNIVIWGASNVQAMTGVTVTIWYTKTTDVAGLGEWNTDGVPTVHYSTSEQVIGTWIDGKPLYAITVDFGSIPSNATKEVDHNITNLKMTVGFEGTMMSGSVCETLPSGENSNFRIQTTTTKLRIITGASWSGWNDSYITLKYTKTTD